MECSLQSPTSNLPPPTPLRDCMTLALCCTSLWGHSVRCQCSRPWCATSWLATCSETWQPQWLSHSYFCLSSASMTLLCGNTSPQLKYSPSLHSLGSSRGLHTSCKCTKGGEGRRLTPQPPLTCHTLQVTHSHRGASVGSLHWRWPPAAAIVHCCSCKSGGNLDTYTQIHTFPLILPLTFPCAGCEVAKARCAWP